MHILLSTIVKHLYARVAGMTWDTVVALTVAHFATSWLLLAFAGGEDIASREVFWYFYVTTVTTIGYGDYSPVTAAGRLIAVVWIMPGGIALFSTIIAKVVQQFADGWRRSMRGLASYEEFENHIVILGWHGSRTERMVAHIRGDHSEHGRAIVLCSAQSIENPMPDDVSFVRGPALNNPDVLRRASVEDAAYIIALGHDDNETLAAALGAAAVAPRIHLVAYFDQQSFADLLKAHCPHAESNVSLSIELMVRSAQDPGSSRVQKQLLSTLEGPTQFSLQVPEDAQAMEYGTLLSKLKSKHDATLFGVADSALGDDLSLNAPLDHHVAPGTILYLMADRRIKASEIEWSDM